MAVVDFSRGKGTLFLPYLERFAADAVEDREKS